MDLPPTIAAQMPFPRRAVRAGDVTLSVVDDGPRDAPETLLFLHGNPAWSFLWRNLLPPVLAAGHRVVAPDLGGFGASDAPEDPSYYSIERHVRELEAVADALALRDVTLVMHDWGGPVGMGFAVTRPDLVKRLVVCNTAAFAPKRARAFSKWHRFFATDVGYALGVRFDLVRRSAMRFGVRRPLPRAVAAAYAWPMRRKGSRVAAAQHVRMVPDSPEHPEARVLARYEADYPKLAEKPMLVLWADRDPVMPPKHAERWKRAFPHADVRHVAPEAGHFWQEDAPEAFVPRLLGFVAEGRSVAASR